MLRLSHGPSWPLFALSVLFLPAFVPVAQAHVTLAVSEAQAGSSYRAVLRIPHGCDGTATRSVRVEIPEGLFAVKPMPKAGWTLATTSGAYARGYQDHGRPVTEGVKTIEWSGGNLPDGHYDEFVFVGTLAGDVAPGQALAFPVLQRCEKGEMNWSGLPGQADAQKSPAPVLRVAAAKDAAPAYKLGSLSLSAPWTRATPGGAKVAGGYVNIANSGTAPDRLVGGSSSIAGRIEIHEMSVTDGVMRMRPLKDGLEIKPGLSVELSPGGYHIMFMDLKQKLNQGESFKATLQFENAGAVEVTFRVGSVGEGAGAASEHKH